MRSKSFWAFAALVLVFPGAMFAVAGIGSGNGPGQTTTASPKQPDRLAIASQNAKQMLFLMDTDKNGRISKREWMKFMSEEFDRLDTDHSGSLDLKELQKSEITVRHVSPEVQGK